MQARLIAYPPEQAAIARQLVAGEALRIGRADDTGLRIDHSSISRAHAELLPRTGGWTLRDLGSKNGCFIDGGRIDEAILDRACWLRLGDVYCEFAPLTEAEAAAGESALRARRVAATAHTARIDGLHRLGDLLDASLRGVLDLAQCERGFVLLGHGDSFMVHASQALDPARLEAREFSGSIGAVRRALELRHSVVVNDIGREAWLATRASVIDAGLSALVCLPLLDGERILGAVYADRVRGGAAITSLDLELLEAFAERASLWITARHANELLAAAAQLPQWHDIVAAHADGPP